MSVAISAAGSRKYGYICSSLSQVSQHCSTTASRRIYNTGDYNMTSCAARWIGMVTRMHSRARSPSEHLPRGARVYVLCDCMYMHAHV